MQATVLIRRQTVIAAGVLVGGKALWESQSEVLANFVASNHVESPFFARIIEQLGLDAEIRRITFDLFIKGYAAIDFPEPDFDLIAESIKGGLHDRFDWEVWHSHGHRDGVSLRVIYQRVYRTLCQ